MIFITTTTHRVNHRETFNRWGEKTESKEANRQPECVFVFGEEGLTVNPPGTLK